MYEVGKAGTLVHVKSDKTMAVGVGEAMDHLEGLLITILDPLLNKRGANWGDATQYYQPDNDHENAIVRRLQALELSMAKLKKDRGT